MDQPLRLQPGPPGSVEYCYEAFSEVPRAFWAGVTHRALRSMTVENIGRLTLPEREHLWRLLGHLDGEPPRRMRITFDQARLLAIGAQGEADEDLDSSVGRLLDALQGATDAPG